MYAHHARESRSADDDVTHFDLQIGSDWPIENAKSRRRDLAEYRRDSLEGTDNHQGDFWHLLHMQC
jgi:hypothetical protein